MAASCAHAGRPLTTEDAGVIEHGKCEVEGLAARMTESDDPRLDLDSLQFSCGAGADRQLALAAQRDRSDGASERALRAGGKTALRPLTRETAGIAIAYAISGACCRARVIRRVFAALIRQSPAAAIVDPWFDSTRAAESFFSAAGGLAHGRIGRRTGPCTACNRPDSAPRSARLLSMKGHNVNRFRIGLIALLVLGVQSAAYSAEGSATKEQAVAMVKKGVAFIKSKGKEPGYAEISNKQGAFVDRDLYLVVYGLDGTVHAHGANERMVGRNLIDLKDVDGKSWVKERVDLAKSNATFWQDYKFTNPTTKKIEPKASYCERLDDTVVCGGVYK